MAAVDGPGGLGLGLGLGPFLAERDHLWRAVSGPLDYLLPGTTYSVTPFLSVYTDCQNTCTLSTCMI